MATISLRDVVAFYDGEIEAGGPHSSAINALMGEELGIGLLLHALHAQEIEAVALQMPCTQGGSRGPRLDRWVRAVRPSGAVLYQVEVKNWCAHSLGGRRLAVDAAGPALAAHSIAMWRRYWNDVELRPVDAPLRKVLTPMRAPPDAGAIPVEPVACVWDALHPQGESMSWFAVPATGDFPHLNWFSMSGYLRALLREGHPTIDIPMPQLEARLAAVVRMIPTAQKVFG